VSIGTGWLLRLGLLALLVPILGPFVWYAAHRALGEAEGAQRPQDSCLVWARRLGILATALLVAIVGFALLGGESVDAP
jgi:hypothetical protein